MTIRDVGPLKERARAQSPRGNLLKCSHDLSSAARPLPFTWPLAEYNAESINGEASVATGVVKFFNEANGYGFIKPDDGGPDVFVHAKDAERAGLPPLLEGMRLGFDIETDPRKGKTKAARLRLL